MRTALAGDAVRLLVRHLVAAGEPPVAIDEDAHAKTERLIVGQRFNVLQPDGDGLRLLSEHADVRVAGALALCGIECAQGEVTHGSLLPDLGRVCTGHDTALVLAATSVAGLLTLLVD